MLDKENIFYRQYLKGELSRRCHQNASYSLRAFSRAMNVDPSQMSRALTGKGPLSLRVGLKVIDRLSLSPPDRKKFLESILLEKQQRALSRQTESNPESQDTFSLSATLFEVMSHWYYPAILELTRIEGFKNDPRWIARELGITSIQARLAVEQLIRIGLLHKKNGTLTKRSPHMDTADKSTTTAALRTLQREVLKKAIEALENDPIEARSITSMTLAIDPKKVPLAKQMIQDFTDRLSDVLESGPRQRVYQFAVNLFPLQRPRRKKP